MKISREIIPRRCTDIPSVLDSSDPPQVSPSYQLLPPLYRNIYKPLASSMADMPIQNAGQQPSASQESPVPFKLTHSHSRSTTTNSSYLSTSKGARQCCYTKQSETPNQESIQPPMPESGRPTTPDNFSPRHSRTALAAGGKR